MRARLRGWRTFRMPIKDRRGTVAIITATAIGVLGGFAGLATDVGYWISTQRNLQGVADAAAYSAAIGSWRGGTSGQTNAYAVAADMGYPNGGNGLTITVNSPPTQGSYASSSYSGKAWEVIVSQPATMFFSQLFLASAPTITARSVASAGTEAPVCILGLDSSSTNTVQTGGSAVINLNCAIVSNSTANNGLSIGGTSSVTASDVITTASRYSTSNGATLTSNDIQVSQPAVADPYASATIPAYGGCDQTGYSPSANVTLSPNTNGTYVFCNGLTINSGTTVTLNPGTYIIDGGQLKMSGSSGLIGNNVTIILTGGTNGQTCCATASIAGGANIQLSAPTTGNLAGLAIFQDRSAPSTSGSTITGGGTQYISGAIYFPSTSLSYAGNATTTGTGACTQIIADKLTFTGNSDVRMQCSGVGVSSIGQQSKILE